MHDPLLDSGLQNRGGKEGGHTIMDIVETKKFKYACMLDFGIDVKSLGCDNSIV